LIEEVVGAVRAGQPVVVPTDTVYGLAADAFSETAVRRLYRLKGRDDVQPTALIGADVDVLLDAVPELRTRRVLESIRELLPGALTLILPNPERRFRWLTGHRPTTIGVRVPALAGEAAQLFRLVGALAATSANRPGEPDPRSVDEIHEELREGSGAVLDVGELPGTPSTVLDLTGAEPVVVREGAVPAAEVFERLSAARG
jgi:L-threonylcarbamoyladenylate synthase